MSQQLEKPLEDVNDTTSGKALTTSTDTLSVLPSSNMTTSNTNESNLGSSVTSISAIAQAPTKFIDSSDSEDENNSLQKSLSKIRSFKNEQIQESFHNLSTILTEEKAPQKFPLLEFKRLLDQKGQMIALNQILEDYMKNNKDLDKNIQTLVDELKKCQNDRQKKEQLINIFIRDIASTKLEVSAATETTKKVKTETKVLQLKNKNLNKECQRCQIEIDALKAKIAGLNQQIDETDGEILADQKEVEEMEPRIKKLKKEEEEAAKETKLKVIDLLKLRKKEMQPNFDMDAEFSKNKPNNNLAKLLAQYRRDCLAEKRKFPDEELDQLRKQVIQAEAAEKDLLNSIKGPVLTSQIARFHTRPG